jgi:hypothetical protein
MFTFNVMVKEIPKKNPGVDGTSLWIDKNSLDDRDQGVTMRFRLSLLTNSALVYEPKCGGRGGVAGSQPVSTAVHTVAQINFGGLTPCLTYGRILTY